ncbi:MAG: 23S rRNA (adenine(2503)-C(2))-methyltransferase RlmN [Sphaerochaetaceae bacterium]|nr:23S rRNA (adenine(2503)-C(2))-methyltransferase RlmN [Sphaerochaetaceae bacterium]
MEHVQRNMPKSLYALKPNELIGALALERPYQGKQIYKWLVRGAKSFSEMSDLPVALRERLEAEMPSMGSSRIISNQRDQSGTVKLGIELRDEAVIECVILTDREERKTACLSSQVGCAMGCTFCRTGTMGLLRNLEAHEIIEQFVHLRTIEPDISHIVFMGMGEPLANFTEVMKSIERLHDPEGFNIGYRKITVSTCGLVPQIIKLAETHIPVRLAVSLVTADNYLRSTLMPVNKAYDLNELKGSLIHYQHVIGKRFTLEYVMLRKTNTDEEAARKLATFTRGLDVIVNLIPWNEVDEMPWKTPSNYEVESFTGYLDKLGVPYTRRISRGRKIDGACGQLAVPLNRKEQ